MSVPQKNSTMDTDKESCKSDNWSALQNELLQQIASCRRDINKRKLRGQMEILSIPVYLNKVNRINRDHEKRLEQIKYWQFLQRKKNVEHNNVRNEIKKRVRKNNLTEEKQLNTGIQNKRTVKDLDSRNSNKKKVRKNKKAEQNAQNQHPKTAPSSTINCFLITKLSNSATIIKKISTSEQLLRKIHFVQSTPSTIETSSPISSLLFVSLNIPEVTPLTSKTVTYPCTPALPDAPLKSSKLLCQPSHSIRQYGPSPKRNRKSKKSGKYESSTESSPLSTNSSAALTGNSYLNLSV